MQREPRGDERGPDRRERLRGERSWSGHERQNTASLSGIPGAGRRTSVAACSGDVDRAGADPWTVLAGRAIVGDEGGTVAVRREAQNSARGGHLAFLQREAVDAQNRCMDDVDRMFQE